MIAKSEEGTTLTREGGWVAWPVNWSGVWVGALTSLAVLAVIGLIAVAVGAHLVGPSDRILSWTDFGLLALAFSISGAFFSAVAGGWVAARVAGIYRAEDAMMHGAIVWLVAIPLLLGLTALGGSRLYGPWYGGLSGTPSWVSAPVPKVTAADDKAMTAEEREKEARDAAKAARNSALGALTALLLGLVGSVLGGWMASGEPMNFAHYYSRSRVVPERIEHRVSV
jgi:hypothetical protein